MIRKTSITLRVSRLLLAIPMLLLGLLPVAGAAQAASVVPGACPDPGTTGDGKSISITLYWSDEPIASGSGRPISIRVTNTGTEPTTQPVRVIGHSSGGAYFVTPDWSTVASDNWDIPAGLAPGASHTVDRNLFVTPSAGASTDVCDFSAHYGDDCATATYNLVISGPQTDLSAKVLDPVSGQPGATVPVRIETYNAGPSNGPSAITLTAPAQTTWGGSVSGYRYFDCTTDDTKTKLTCSSLGYGPLAGHRFDATASLVISPDAVPGATLDGGLAVATSPYDPEPDPGAAFSVSVV